MNRKLAVLAGLLVLSGNAWADDEETKVEPSQSPQIEVIDIPTADILDPITFATTFRLYNQGGLTSRFILGPLKMVNLGISFDAQRVIGSGDPHMVTPAVFFKVKPYDGSDFRPALALGYDNQGMLWQESTDEYMHREKGLYLVG